MKPVVWTLAASGLLLLGAGLLLRPDSVEQPIETHPRPPVVAAVVSSPTSALPPTAPGLSPAKTDSSPPASANFLPIARRENPDPAPSPAFRAADVSPVAPAERAFAPGPVNPGAEGNAISFRGQRVAVAETLGIDRNGRPALAVDVAPDGSAEGSATADETHDASPNIAETRADDSGSPTADATPPSDAARGDSAAPRRSRLQVYTPEELAFRTRWGWEAFDLMRREADREAANQTATGE